MQDSGREAHRQSVLGGKSGSFVRERKPLLDVYSATLPGTVILWIRHRDRHRDQVRRVGIGDRTRRSDRDQRNTMRIANYVVRTAGGSVQVDDWRDAGAGDGDVNL